MDTRAPPDTSNTKQPPAEKLAALRAAMKKAGVDGYLVPHGDEHQGESPAPYAERLKWLPGVSGSAGLAVVFADTAVIFVDGRYTLQVKTQVDGKLYQYAHLVDDPPHTWLAKKLSPGMRLGFDPRLHTPAGLKRLEKGVKKAGAELLGVSHNLIDEIWTDQPARPTAPVSIYPEKFAGRSSAEKR
ncbi:MAG: aminopeptidase P family N-terminal domain-containing protein, partial [Rhodospirillaceae bacterium]